MSYIAEYLWIDGTKPSAKIRSKAKVIAGEVLDRVRNKLGY